MSITMISFYSLSFQRLRALFINQGLNPQAASLLFNWHYKKKRKEFCSEVMSRSTVSFIANNLSFQLPLIHSVSKSDDRTVKFLFELESGFKVEAVLIPFHNKYTLCLSSQVGCGMNCSFCSTGRQGFTKHLSTSEIVGQYLETWRWLKFNRPGEERILNIVFMGQGEPLHNFDNVRSACEIFLSQHGISIAAQKITVSTSGYLPGLSRWAQEMPGVNLALSLHSPTEELRNQLIPINKKFSLKDVLDCIDKIPLSKKQFVTYEYLLIENVNDSSLDAHRTGRLLQNKRAYVNLIPFNPFPGSNYRRPPTYIVNKFKNILDSYKIPTIIRTTKGDDVLAACGQLNTMFSADQ